MSIEDKASQDKAFEVENNDSYIFVKNYGQISGNLIRTYTCTSIKGKWSIDEIARVINHNSYRLTKEHLYLCFKNVDIESTFKDGTYKGINIIDYWVRKHNIGFGQSIIC